MSEFPVHTIDTAPPASRSSLQGLQQEIGFIPNLAATMADSPTLIEGFTRVRTILGQSAFTPLERETISLSMSVANECSYCIAAHSTFAKMAGAVDTDIASLREGGDPADPRLAAMRDRSAVSVTLQSPSSRVRGGGLKRMRRGVVLAADQRRATGISKTSTQIG